MTAHVVHSSDWKRPLAVIELTDSVVDMLEKYGSAIIPANINSLDDQSSADASCYPIFHGAAIRGLVLRAAQIRRHSVDGTDNRSTLFVYLHEPEDVELLYGVQHAMLIANYGKLNRSAFGRHIISELKSRHCIASAHDE